MLKSNSPLKNISFIISVNFSIPTLFFADISTGLNSEKALYSSSVKPLSRSVLFKIRTDFLDLISSNNSLSSEESGLDTSIIISTRSASLRCSFALSIPILSISLSVSLIPAVSTILREISPRLTFCIRASLVVPGISVTMATSSPEM